MRIHSGTGTALAIQWLAAAAAFLVCGQTSAQTVIHAGRVLTDPSAGRVETGRSIIVKADGVIDSIEAGYVTREGARIVDLRDRFVLPGLIDSHVHLRDELDPRQLLERVQLTAADFALRAAENARKTVHAGFTTVADLGAPNEAIFALRRAIAERRIEGPRIVASGSSVTADGGHGDVQGYAPDVMEALRSVSACSGADACRRAVRRQIQAGADIIKTTATGGVLSNTAAGVAQQLSDDELRAIVDAAHSMGRRVTAHAHSAGGINAALRAGVDSIEHGSYLDEEGVRLLREGNRYLVPTLLAGAYVAEMAERPGFLTPAQADKARQVGPELIEMARRARAARVRIAFGTDTGVSPHGDNAREFELLVQAGYTPLEAIQFATTAAADHLQLPDVAGRIAPGFSADIIAVDGDPLANVSVLRNNVVFVMARGDVVKGP